MEVTLGAKGAALQVIDDNLKIFGADCERALGELPKK